jgi:hypothetical protein
LPLSGPGGGGTGGGGVEAAPPSERTATRGGKGGVPALSGRTATHVGGGAQVSSGEDGRARWQSRGIGVFGATTWWRRRDDTWANEGAGQVSRRANEGSGQEGAWAGEGGGRQHARPTASGRRR